MTRVKTVDVESRPGPGGSSNIIQLGSMLGMIILGFIVLVLLFKGDDTQFDKRIAEMDRHHVVEMQQAKDAYADKLRELERRFNHRDEYDDMLYSHITKDEAVMQAHGLPVPPKLPAPPQ